MVSSNAEPYNTQYITLNLIVSNRIKIDLTKNASLVYPGDVVSFDLGVSSFNGSGIEGLVADNVSMLRLRYDTEYIDFEDYQLDELGNGNYVLNVTLPDGLVGGIFSLWISIVENRGEFVFTGDVSFGISVKGEHLDAVYVSGYTPNDIDFRVDVSSLTYKINITNKGNMNSSTPISARLTTTCPSSVMSISSSLQTIDIPIEPSSSRIISWAIEPKLVRTSGCEIKINVSGGSWWSNSSEKVIAYTVNVTNSSVPAVVPEAEDSDDDGADGTGYECSSSFDCDDDESCDGNVCVTLTCSDGKVAKNHRCIIPESSSLDDAILNYSMIFVGNYSDVEIERGKSALLIFDVKNDGEEIIENLEFSISVDDEFKSFVERTLDSLSTLAVGRTTKVGYNVSVPVNTTSGYHYVTVSAVSDNVTIEKMIRIKIAFSENEIEEIEDNINSLDEAINTLEDVIEKMFEGSEEDSADAEVLNETLVEIKRLYEEAKLALENGDYFAANEKKDVIDSLMREMINESDDIANSLNGLSKLSSTMWVVLFVLLFSSISYLVVRYDVQKKVSSEMKGKDFSGVINLKSVKDWMGTSLNVKTSRRTKDKVKKYMDRKDEDEKFFKEQEDIAKQEMAKLKKGDVVKEEVRIKSSGVGGGKVLNSVVVLFKENYGYLREGVLLVAGDFAKLVDDKKSAISKAAADRKDKKLKDDNEKSENVNNDKVKTVEAEPLKEEDKQEQDVKEKVIEEKIIEKPKFSNEIMCRLCNMTFETKAALELHQKYAHKSE